MSCRRICVICTILICAGSGCISVREEYQRPDFKAHDKKSWDGRLDGVYMDQELDPEHLSEWWRQLNDDKLNSLIERAIASNLDLREAQTRLNKARAQWKSSKSSNMPSIQANTSAIGSKGSESTGTGDKATLYAAGLDAGWEIDLFGGKRALVDAASADAQSLEEEKRDILVSVIAEVAINYTDLTTLNQRKDLFENIITNQQRNLKIINAKRDAGSVSSLDVTRARANVEKVRAQIPSLDQQITKIENRLAVLIGSAPGSITKELQKTAAFHPSAPIRVAVGIPAQTIRRRPDVRAAERQLASATYRIGVAKAELYPKFTFSGTIGWESLSSSSLLESSSQILGFGPSVKWNLFNGGRVRQEINIQSESQKEALIRYEAAVLNAMEDVENAITSLTQEQLRKKYLSIVASESQKSYELASARYEAGETDYLVALDAERSLLDAKDSLVVSDGQILINIIRLYKALGGGWDSELPEKRQGGTQ